MSAVTVANVSKSFGETPVLSGIDIDITDGEFVALLGPSGCGKSTLLRILAGLEQPTEGRIFLDDEDVTDRDPSHRDIALVFQSYALYPHKTVYENIAFPLRMRAPWHTRIPYISRFFPARRRLDREIVPRAREVAAQVGIEGYLDRKPAALSGGQRQRVALARALVRKPVAFLMDEPLSNLDAKLRASMRVELSDLHRRLGTTFVYVTHDQVEATTMADRVVLMNGGSIQQVGPPMALYDDPANRFVAEFIGTPTISMLPLRLDAEGNIRVSGAPAITGPLPRALQIAAGRGGAVAGIRPNHVSLAGGQEGLDCLVRFIEPLGADAYMDVSVVGVDRRPVGDDRPPEDRIILKLDTAKAVRYRQGDRVRVSVDWSKALYFDGDGQRIRTGADGGTP